MEVHSTQQQLKLSKVEKKSENKKRITEATIHCIIHVTDMNNIHVWKKGLVCDFSCYKKSLHILTGKDCDGKEKKFPNLQKKSIREEGGQLNIQYYQ